LISPQNKSLNLSTPNSPSLSNSRITGPGDNYSLPTSLTLAKNGCFIPSSIVILFFGLNNKHFYNKSIASTPAAGYNSFKSLLFLGGKDFKYSMALASVTNSNSSSVGVPRTEKIIFS